MYIIAVVCRNVASPLCQQLRLPRSSTPRCQTLPPRRRCVCAGACSPTTRWSTTISTTGRFLRTRRQTASLRRTVQHNDTHICWRGNLLISLCLVLKICARFPVSNVKVKETHCTVTDLLPNAQYELWVTATNTTGISPASEKALYMTGNKCLLQLRANSSHFWQLK